MSFYLHVVGYTFVASGFFFVGFAVGIAHERHRLARRIPRRVRRT